MTATRYPFSTSRCAETLPPKPEPMTMKSKSYSPLGDVIAGSSIAFSSARAEHALRGCGKTRFARFVSEHGFTACWKTLVNALGGSPLLQQGELDFSPAEKCSISIWALAPVVQIPGAKARDQSSTSPGALKRSFPRINAGAPTKSYIPPVTLRLFQQTVHPYR